MNKTNKVIVVGATGYLGKPLLAKAKTCGEAFGTSSIGTGCLHALRLDQPTDFDYRLVRPLDVVLMTAAISSPEVCSKEFDFAWKVNVAGTCEFVANVMGLGARVIFFSSDTVYGCVDMPFGEGLVSAPVGKYAEMKLAVETEFLAHPLFKSIRLSYIFSRDDRFTKYLFECARAGVEAELFHPFYRAIVHRDDVVEGVLTLVRRWDEFPQSVINFGGPEVLSRLDMAKILQNSVMPRLRFRVIEHPPNFFEMRPKVIRMTSRVLTLLLGQNARTLNEAAAIEFGESND